ncbi:MAG: hypothetical protein HYR96_08240 [Deltaproteobacteria bacterium]|nr:hypothetical protein [Deltaproteobacteria bacterium]MBI3293496.1 hypothetical protein [Deltaproteobacteria bacterium]
MKRNALLILALAALPVFGAASNFRCNISGKEGLISNQIIPLNTVKHVSVEGPRSLDVELNNYEGALLVGIKDVSQNKEVAFVSMTGQTSLSFFELGLEAQCTPMQAESSHMDSLTFKELSCGPWHYADCGCTCRPLF